MIDPIAPAPTTLADLRVALALVEARMHAFERTGGAPAVGRDLLKRRIRILTAIVSWPTEVKAE